MKEKEIVNRLDKQYQQLLQDILDNGVKKGDRTGTGTLSVFGRQIRYKMSEGFPLLTTKKMAWNSIVAELLWFLKGNTDIRFLWEDECYIWDGDWYKNYKTSCSTPYTLEEIKQLVKQGDHYFHDSMFDLGPIYGHQWRMWEGRPGMFYDQIKNLINELKTNPDSRRLMVNAWNVGELDQMTLPPCHYGFQCWTKEEDGKRYLSLMWNQRSVDTFLGLPFNIASYGLLLEIIAREVNMIPEELIGNLGDTHLYLNHIEQAKEQINRESFDLPELKFSNWYELVTTHSAGNTRMFFHNLLDQLKVSDFKIENYQSHPAIKAPLSN